MGEVARIVLRWRFAPPKAFAVLLPVKTVGVMGDGRRYQLR